MTTSRLLPIQKNYLEGMEILLELYYLLKSLPEDQWFSEKIIRRIARLFTLTISNFSKSIFYWDGYDYHLRYGKGDPERNKNTNVKINEREFRAYLKIFDDLYQEAVNDTLKEAYKVERTAMLFDVLPVESKQLKMLSQEMYSPIKKISQSFPCKIYRDKEPWHVKGEWDKKIYDLIHSDLGNLPVYNEVLYVDINYDSHLIYSLSKFGPDIKNDDTHIGEIQSPPPSKETSFCDVIRYIIAKYYVLFGSFDRIKVCLNDKCKKLMVEKKLGARQCCNKKCRMEYNKNRQSKEVRLCRERQNNWMRNKRNREDIKNNDNDKMPVPYLVQKNDCDTCAKPVKSGQCKRLKELNSKSLKILSHYPKRAKLQNWVKS